MMFVDTWLGLHHRVNTSASGIFPSLLSLPRAETVPELIEVAVAKRGVVPKGDMKLCPGKL